MRNWNEKWNSDPLSCLSVYRLIIRDIAKEEEDILHIPFSISFYVEKNRNGKKIPILWLKNK